MRADQMAPVLDEPAEQGYVTPEKFKRQVVAYNGNEAPGTIVIDTGSTFLYLVQGNGRAIRYGIGVGRDGFRWQGTQTHHQEGRVAGLDAAAGDDRSASPTCRASWPVAPANPLGARAMYLGSTIYRIHGTNAPHDDRPACLLGLHPPDERRRDRPRQPRERRHQGGRDQQRRRPLGVGPDGLLAGEPAAFEANCGSRGSREGNARSGLQGNHAGRGNSGRRFL